MQKKKLKKLNIFLLIAIIVVVLFNTLLIFSVSRTNVETSLVRKYWGGSTQCVAYVQKYYQDVFGKEILNVGRAQDLYLKAPDYGLFAHRNGGAIAPQPGHIMVFEHRNKIGHVAIITGRLHDGVLITEQNWGTSRITTNHNVALPMKVENGNYIVADREGYKVLGWVGLTLENPTTYFDFSSENSEGWVPEHQVSIAPPDDISKWAVVIEGQEPSIISPIFIQPIAVSDHPYINFRAQSYNFSSNQQDENEQGFIHLRDENDEWSEKIPFDVIQSTEIVNYSIDLSELRDDFAITQMRIQMPDYARNSGNLWEFDWLEIAREGIGG